MKYRALLLQKTYRRTAVLVGLSILVVSGLIFYTTSRDSTVSAETERVVKRSIERVVEVTGRVEPLQKAVVSFTASGNIASLHVKEGDRVAHGTVLAILDHAVSDATVREANADVLREERKLAEMRAGPQYTTIEARSAHVSARKTALSEAEGELRNAVRAAYVTAHGQIKQKADELFENPDGVSPSFGITFSSGGTQYIISAQAEEKIKYSDRRRDIGSILSSWPVPTNDTLEADAEKALEGLRTIESFFGDLTVAMSRYTSRSSQDGAVYGPYQTNVASGRLAMTSALRDVSQSLAGYRSARDALMVAERDLSELRAGVSVEALRVQEAGLLRARETRERVLRERERNILIAPLSGVVTGVRVTAGEMVTAGAPVLTVQSEEAYEIHAFIPEADIGEVHVDQRGTAVFDAFEDTGISVKVLRVDPGETVREGVPTYKTIFVPEKDDPRVRSGMTADVEVLVDARENVLVVPSRSILRKSEGAFVRVRRDGVMTERAVVPGMVSSDGVTEILSGLEEGEEVVVFME
jgi:HlyD family secretion protein